MIKYLSALFLSLSCSFAALVPIQVNQFTATIDTTNMLWTNNLSVWSPAFVATGGASSWNYFGQTYFTNQIVGGSTNLVGTVLNDVPLAGRVGEVVQTNTTYASAITLTSATSANVAALTLPAGDWDVTSECTYTSKALTVTVASAYTTTAISTVSATLQANSATDAYWLIYRYLDLSTKVLNDTACIPKYRYSTTSSSTIYLVANVTYSGNTLYAWGNMVARRVR